MNKIGKYLKQRRVDSELAQHDLMKTLGFSSPQYISNVERGICGPPINQLYNWCMTVGANREYIYNLLLDKQKEKYKKALKP